MKEESWLEVIDREPMVYQTGLHWFGIILPALLMIFGGQLLFRSEWIGGVVLVLGLLFFLNRWLRYRRTKFVVTEKHVLILESGLRSFAVVMSLSDGTAIQIFPSTLFDRVFGMGRMLVPLRDGTSKVYFYVRNAGSFRAAITRQALLNAERSTS